MKKLLEKYPKHYCRQMGNFDFIYEELTFEILQDFNGWKQTAMFDGNEAFIIFYQD